MQGQKIIFFLIIFPSPLLHPSEAPCPTPAQSWAAFAESRAHGHFWEYFPNAHPEFCICRCTGADQSSHPIFQAQKPTCAFFSPFETKDANGGGGSEYVENMALPLTAATEKGWIVTRANCQRRLRTSGRLGGCRALWKTMLPLSSFFSRSDASGHSQWHWQRVNFSSQ